MRPEPHRYVAISKGFVLICVGLCKNMRIGQISDDKRLRAEPDLAEHLPHLRHEPAPIPTPSAYPAHRSQPQLGTSPADCLPAVCVFDRRGAVILPGFATETGDWINDHRLLQQGSRRSALGAYEVARAQIQNRGGSRRESWSERRGCHSAASGRDFAGQEHLLLTPEPRLQMQNQMHPRAGLIAGAAARDQQATTRCRTHIRGDDLWPKMTQRFFANRAALPSASPGHFSTGCGSGVRRYLLQTGTPA